MKMQFRNISIVVVFMSLLLSCMVANAQNSEQFFGYGYIAIDGETTTLTIVRPSNTTVWEVMNIPKPTNYSLAQAIASPNGQWVAIAFEQYSVGTIFSLLNPTTGELIEIAEFAHTEQLKLEWAPDSNSLAFNGHIPDTQLYGIYVFSLLTHQHELIQLTEETEYYRDFPYDFVWSNSGDSLAVVSTNCHNQWCAPKFRLYAMPSRDLLASAVFDTLDGTVCNLNLAEGMRYLSFATPCGDIRAAQFYEVFVWDTQSGEFIQVTHYTNVLGEILTNSSEFITLYDGIWLTNQELLLSVFNVEREPNQALPETSLYRTGIYSPPFTAMTIVPGDSATGYGWVKNPITGNLAYRLETYRFNPWPEINTSSVQIAAYDDQTLMSLYSGPTGCDLRWSPDGKWLGYLSTASWDIWHSCQDFVSLNFVENGSENESNYVFPAAEHIIPVGWLIVLPPVSQAGPDQTLTDTDSSGSEPVTLDGSGSSDPDGTIVGYSWTENEVEIATGATPTVELGVGVHTITLTVTDNDGATASDEVVITVEAPATPRPRTTPRPGGR